MDYYNLDKNKTFLVSQKALIVDKGKILVLKNTMDIWGRKSQWELPGGLLEFSEHLSTSLKREVKEETGLDITIGKPFTVLQHQLKGFIFKDKRVLDTHIVGIAYLCSKLSGKIKLSWEHTSYLWASGNDLRKLDIAPNSKVAIRLYLEDNKSLIV